MMKIYVPRNLPKRIYQGEYSDQRLYFLHKIYEERVYNKEYAANSYVSINATIMRSIIGRWCYDRVKNELLDIGVIESDNRYIVGEKSKGYRLTKKYREEKHTQKYITEKRLIERVENFKKARIDRMPNSIEYCKLYEWLTKIDIRHKDAMDFILRNYQNSKDKLNCNGIAINKINEKDFFFVVDNSAGRLHTNITNLARDLRMFLQIEDKSTVNVDISNSQPFLFNILIKEYENGIAVPNRDYYEMCCNTEVKNKFLSYVGQARNDVQFYEKLTCAGKFYEFLIEAMGYTGDRNAFKKDFFGKVFFSENKPHYVYSEKRKFDKLFPSVGKIIDYYKKGDKKSLPVALQKAEREIIINDVAKRIITERPDIPIVTIHDSILTTYGNEGYVADVMKEQFNYKYSLAPNVKYEYFS